MSGTALLPDMGRAGPASGGASIACAPAHSGDATQMLASDTGEWAHASKDPGVQQQQQQQRTRQSFSLTERLRMHATSPQPREVSAVSIAHAALQQRAWDQPIPGTIIVKRISMPSTAWSWHDISRPGTWDTAETAFRF